MGFYLGIALAVGLGVYLGLSFYNDAEGTWVKIIGFIKSIWNKITASVKNFFLKIWKFIKWILNVCWDIVSYIPRKFGYKILYGSWILLKYLIYLIIISGVLYMIYIFIKWGKGFVKSDAFVVILLYTFIPASTLLIMDIFRPTNKNDLNKTEKDIKEEKKKQQENFNKRNKLMLRFFMFVPLFIIIGLVIWLAILLIKQHLS